MLVNINGSKREVPEGLKLNALLEWMGLPLERIAVERNLEVVPRASWKDTTVEAGDRLEVVQLVGGGKSLGKGRAGQPL